MACFREVYSTVFVILPFQKIKKCLDIIFGILAFILLYECVAFLLSRDAILLWLP
jgi:hypothetical protein